MRGLWAEFQDFALKGNLMQLAVAFVLGVAFAAVVTSLVDDIIMPIVGAVVSDESFAGLTFELAGVEVFYGNFLTVLFTFLVIALVLFFIVKGYNQLVRAEEEPPEPATKRCPYCMTDIPLEATRCPNCTSQLAETPVAQPMSPD